AVPLLGIATDYVTPLLLRGEAAAPWRNPSSILWSLWGVLTPLVGPAAGGLRSSPDPWVK
ncbi:MAG TPA: hypothetical protein VEU30_02490, partial [Thermoanaerobaculia bacterium]|nr:hypothetical protein [Thermoanaerobaculia bacterium]